MKMKVKVFVVSVVLAAAFLLSCTTTTGTNGDGGVTEYAFDWAYQIAKSYAEEYWGDWDTDTVLAFFDCVLADAKCMLGRPLENSYWLVWFQNDEAELYSVEINEDGEEDGTDHGVSGVDFNEVPAYSNSKLEEMMAFCIDEDNDYWDLWDSTADDYWWFVEVSSDYGDWWAGVDNIFRIWFFERQGDVDEWNYWGYIVIDCDGHDNDYDILDFFRLNEGAPYTDAPQGMPLSRMLAR